LKREKGKKKGEKHEIIQQRFFPEKIYARRTA